MKWIADHPLAALVAVFVIYAIFYGGLFVLGLLAVKWVFF